MLDGIMYRLIECDNIEIFADRGVYLTINDHTFFDREAFIYNEDTGEVSPRRDYEGVSVVFDLPLDKDKADPTKAETRLQEIMKEMSPDTTRGSASMDDGAEKMMEELKKKISDGTVIPESIKEVTFDDQGRINYEYDGWDVKLSPELMFEEGQTGFSDSIHFSKDNHNREMALQFHKDENGVITGRVIILN